MSDKNYELCENTPIVDTNYWTRERIDSVKPVEMPRVLDIPYRKIFSPEEVKRLNEYQTKGEFHPYTCGGNRTDENHLDGEGILLATEYGWICPYCDYKQGWIHEMHRDKK